jgi:hypothetical protein
VQVPHRQHQRVLLTGVLEELPQERKSPRPAGLRAQHCQGLWLYGHVQALQQQQRLGVRADPCRVQPRLDEGSEDVRRGGLGQVPELSQQVAYREIGRGAAIGQAVALAVGHRLPSQALGEFHQ